MAELDMSDAFGPEFLDAVTVIRRQETVNSNGESEVTPTTIKNVLGVVTAATPDDLLRLQEYDAADRHICFVTQFVLRGPAEKRHYGGESYKPDVIQWQGNSYVVKTLDPYTHFGSGFIQSICGSVEFIDLPPEES